jgi:hypothetical protein
MVNVKAKRCIYKIAINNPILILGKTVADIVLRINWKI